MKEEEKPQNFVCLSLSQHISYLWGGPFVECFRQRTESGGRDDWLRLDTDFTFLSEVGSEETPAPGKVIPGSAPGFSNSNLGISPRLGSPQMLFAWGGSSRRSPAASLMG